MNHMLNNLVRFSKIFLVILLFLASFAGIAISGTKTEVLRIRWAIADFGNSIAELERVVGTELLENQ